MSFTTPYTEVYATGKQLQITVPPAAATQGKNYLFSSWEDSSVNPTRNVTLNTDKSLMATYLQAAALTLTATEGGSTSPSPSRYFYAIGPVYTFTALPSANYNFDHWELDGANKGSDPQISLTITQALDGATLTAVFTKLLPQQIVLNIAVSGNGTTDILAGQHLFNVGDTIEITAIPAEGESFIQWTLNGLAYATTTTVSIPIDGTLNNSTLTANFTSVTPPTSSNYLLLLLLGMAAVAAS